MGTDAGNIGTLHGPSVFREMELMAQAGLTPLEVLRAATTNGAHAMGREDLGAMAAGKLADLVMLDADPLAAQNLSRIHRVIKDGRVFAPEELMRSISGQAAGRLSGPIFCRRRGMQPNQAKIAGLVRELLIELGEDVEPRGTAQDAGARGQGARLPHLRLPRERAAR